MPQLKDIVENVLDEIIQFVRSDDGRTRVPQGFDVELCDNSAIEYVFPQSNDITYRFYNVKVAQVLSLSAGNLVDNAS